VEICEWDGTEEERGEGARERGKQGGKVGVFVGKE
jgi:hypothetical protein